MKSTGIVEQKRPDLTGASLIENVARLNAPSGLMGWQLRKQDLTGARKHLLVLGYVVIGIYLLSFIAPNDALTVIRPCCLIAAAIFLFTCTIRKDVKVHLVAPIAIAFLLQLWSFAVSLYVSLHLGRPLEFGRAETYILESTLPFFVTCALIEVDTDARTMVQRLYLIPAGLSVFFGLGQFGRIPLFLAFAKIYTYKPLDFWDGHPGLRAVGLTFHPSSLGMQAALAFVVIVCAARTRKMTGWEIFGLFYFSAGVAITQDRTMYAPFLIFWGVLIFWLVRRDIRRVWVLIGISIACIAILAALAPRRFSYLTQGGVAAQVQNPAQYPLSYYMLRPDWNPDPKWMKEPEWKDSASSAVQSSDTSLNYRYQIWKAQMQPIWPEHRFTGIGPSSGLLNGTGPEDKYVPIGRVMESGYLLMVAMYGIPGLLLFVGGLVVSGISLLRVAKDKVLSDERRNAALTACAAVVMVAAGCATANTVDNYMKVPLAWMMGGLAVKSSLDAWNGRQGARAKLSAAPTAS